MPVPLHTASDLRKPSTLPDGFRMGGFSGVDFKNGQMRIYNHIDEMTKNEAREFVITLPLVVIPMKDAVTNVKYSNSDYEFKYYMLDQKTVKLDLTIKTPVISRIIAFPYESKYRAEVDGDETWNR